MIAVYYPYYAKGATWDELRYSLRSIEKNLQCDFEVYIVGDLPEWVQNVHHIPHSKTFDSHGQAVYDTLSKLNLYLEDTNTPEEFIRMYDDVYLLEPVILNDLQVTRFLYKGIKYLARRKGVGSGSNTWKEQVWNTLMTLTLEGFPDYMTETHCPEIFFKSRMRWLLNHFRALDNRLLVSTLYFNVFPFPNMICDRKKERILFYGEENEFSSVSENISEKTKGKKYLNHNDLGLNSALQEFIKNTFPHKSKFEK